MLLNISIVRCFKPIFGTHNDQPMHYLCHLLISIQLSLSFLNQSHTPNQILDNNIVLKTLETFLTICV